MENKTAVIYGIGVKEKKIKVQSRERVSIISFELAPERASLFPSQISFFISKFPFQYYNKRFDFHFILFYLKIISGSKHYLCLFFSFSAKKSALIFEVRGIFTVLSS